MDGCTLSDNNTQRSVLKCSTSVFYLLENQPTILLLPSPLSPRELLSRPPLEKETFIYGKTSASPSFSLSFE